MAWIELHQSVWTHRKTYTLADALAIPPIYAVAHLAALWCWCLDNAPSGRLNNDSKMLARASYYRGSPENYLAALMLAGYVSRIDDNTIQIHDWQDYAGKLIDRRAQQRDSMRRLRAEQQQEQKPPVNITLTSREHHVNNTLPPRDITRAQVDPTQPNQLHTPPLPPQGEGNVKTLRTVAPTPVPEGQSTPTAGGREDTNTQGEVNPSHAPAHAPGKTSKPPTTTRLKSTSASKEKTSDTPPDAASLNGRDAEAEASFAASMLEQGWPREQIERRLREIRERRQKR